MQHTTNTIVDKVAMALSGALILLGVVVLGLVEILAGEPYSPAPLTNDAGDVIASPMIDPNIRTGLVIAGLVVMLVWGVYKMVATDVDTTETGDAYVTAD